MADERRARMTELYAATRDGAVAADIAVGRVRALGDPRPSYVRASAAPPEPGSQAATIGRLASLFPGSVVRRTDS